jgi:phosphoenolpyruvate-protein kinase (PTS system EI component)
VLSHGAIVAREFGLPGVAGLAGVHKRLKTGQRLRIDGASGTVTVLDTGKPPADIESARRND